MNTFASMISILSKVVLMIMQLMEMPLLKIRL
jgi:hypothetical protein